MKKAILILVLLSLSLFVSSQNYTFRAINYSVYNKQTKSWGQKINCEFDIVYTELGLKFTDTNNTEIVFTIYNGKSYKNGESTFTYSAYYKSNNEYVDVQFVIYENSIYNATWFIYSKYNIIAYEVLID